MGGGAFRMVGIWIATTVLTVFGVDAAIERVARDVGASRPAPMTPGQVDRQLRERDRSTDGRSDDRGPTGATLPPPSSTTSTLPTRSTTTTPNRPTSPSTTGPGRPEREPGDQGTTGTTTAAGTGSHGAPDEQERPPRP